MRIMNLSGTERPFMRPREGDGPRAIGRRVLSSWLTMGTIIGATCECGYAATLSLGGGMRNFMNSCAVPACCEHCREAVTVDYMAPATGAADCARWTCGSCGSDVIVYAERDTAGRRSGFAWRLPSGEELVVPESGNVCPACSASTLAFEFRGNID